MTDSVQRSTPGETDLARERRLMEIRREAEDKG